MSFINQHSFILTALFVEAVLAILLFRDGIRALDVVALVTIAIAFAISWLMLRPGAGTMMDGDALQAKLESTGPTLLEIQSEY
jgi:Mn2+/Fe2+ NRAMP family transporter